jgi:glycosyltransferase involved in cell wall biosynthesis
MKVCILGNVGDSHVHARIALVSDLGHQVTVISPAGKPGVPGTKTLTYRGRDQSAGALRVLVGYAREHWEAYRIARRVGADIYHVHYASNSHAWTALLAGLRPLVVSTMGGDILAEERQGRTAIDRWLLKLLLRSADTVTSKSDYITSKLIAFGVKPERILKVVWGVDRKRFSPGDSADLRGRLGIGPDDPVVLSARNLRPFYNIQLIVEAMALVLREVPQAKLVISSGAATEEYLAQVCERITALGIDDSVRWMLNTEPADMVKVYRLADVAVSLAPSDGLPMTLMEAMACGCPTVLTDLSCYRELVQHDHSAVFAPLEASAVRAQIVRVLNDHELRKRLVAQGLDRVAERADQASDLRRLNALYHKLATAPSPTALLVTRLGALMLVALAPLWAFAADRTRRLQRLLCLGSLQRQQ